MRQLWLAMILFWAGVTAQAQDLFRPGLDGLCAAGQQMAAGCDAIRERQIVDAAAPEWRPIGRVNFASIEQRSHCTGTLIAQDIVLTAAHCLYNSARQSWIPPQSLRFAAGYQRGEAQAVTSVKDYVLDPQHDTDSRIFENDNARDWALLILADPIGQNLGFFQLGTDLQANQTIIAGYPGLREHVLSVSDTCGVLGWPNAQGVLVNHCAAMKGDSGAPLLALDAEGIRVVGVLSAVAPSPDGLLSISVPTSAVRDAVQATTAW